MNAENNGMVPKAKSIGQRYKRFIQLVNKEIGTWYCAAVTTDTV